MYYCRDYFCDSFSESRVQTPRRVRGWGDGGKGVGRGAAGWVEGYAAWGLTLESFVILNGSMIVKSEASCKRHSLGGAQAGNRFVSFAVA